jgi:putative membrane protein
MVASDKTNSGKAALIRTIVALVVLVLGLWGLFHVNPADAYLWVKAIHVIAVIAWMAGMLYLPRL